MWGYAGLPARLFKGWTGRNLHVSKWCRRTMCYSHDASSDELRRVDCVFLRKNKVGTPSLLFVREREKKKSNAFSKREKTASSRRRGNRTRVNDNNGKRTALRNYSNRSRYSR